MLCHLWELAENALALYDSSCMTKKTKQTIIWIISILVIFGALVAFLIHQGKKPGQYDDLAQCITDSGAKFYGAFWCPHCQAQKTAFGKSAKLLPYIECSEPNGQGQTEACIDAGIQSYPTWEFADGTRQSGRIDVADLALLTNCSVE